MKLVLLSLLGFALAAPAHAETRHIGRHGALLDSTEVEHPELPPLNTRVRLSMLPDSTSSEPKDRRQVVIYDDGDWDDGDPQVMRFSGKRKLNFTLEGRYTRIEGMALALGFERRLSRETFVPAYHGEVGYAFSGKFGKFNVGFEQPLAPKNKLTLGAEGYRRFIPTFYGGEIVSSGENTASMLFLKKEYRDWFEDQGARAFVGVRPSPFVTLHAGVRLGDESSVATATTWSSFNQKNPVPDNPAVDDGDYFGYFADVTFDSRPRGGRENSLYSRPHWSTIEYFYRLSWERADPSVRGDFHDWAVTADLRTYVRLARRQSVWLRVLGGAGHGRAGDGTQLAAQRRYVLGGVGTLRGQNFKSLEGNRVALANLEYVFGVSKSLSALFLVDAGTAWDEGSLFSQRIRVDLGTGIRLGERGVSVALAKNINDTDSDVKVVLRLEDTF